MANHRTPAELRQEAARCLELPTKALVPSTRETLNSLAKTYEEMARQVEELMKDGLWPPPK